MEEQRPDLIRMPQEEMLEVEPRKGSLTIGVPKEGSLQENRLALVPDGVALLARNGHTVVLQSGAGAAAHFSDHAFSEAGARWLRLRST